MHVVRAIIIGAAIFVVSAAAGAQEARVAPSEAASGEASTISVLIESADPAIDSSALRAALSEALARPVAAVAQEPLLTIVGTVGPEGPASVQIIGARTETFQVPRGEVGWLLRWLRQQVVRRVGPSPPSLVMQRQVLARGESAAGLTPPLAEVEASVATRTTGWLNLLSVPPATVTMMGQRIGATPLVGREMPPGTHKLVLTTADGVSQAIDVTIERGRRTVRALSIR